MEYYAHRDGERTQTVTTHLKAVSQRCGELADAFGAGKQGAWIGLAHDIGKCSAAFQKRLQGGAKVDHSTAGAVECLKANYNALWAAECVAGHHSGLLDFGNPRDPPKTKTLWGRIKNALPPHNGIPKYENPIDSADFSFPSAPPGYGKDLFTDSFFIRMLYSCLVDADYLDTEAFMSAGGVRRGGGESLSALLECLMEKKVRPWLEEAEHPKPDLNQRQLEILQTRCQILRTCLDGATRPKGLYTLTVPTGGGKTVSSMAFALRHAVQHGMKRIIYVIPYTSIIEQNAKVFREIFGAENVLEHHSNASHENPRTVRNAGNQDAAAPEKTDKTPSDNADEDCGTDGPKTRASLAAENWDIPIVVTTAVQFFESLYANRSAKCRKIHNIANSVIVFDEAQMLPVSHLLPCVAAIAELTRNFQSTVLLCTATQPALNQLFAEYGLYPEELCPDTARLYERFRRVTYRTIGTIDADTLAESLRESRQALCIVNTRKAAQEIYAKLPEEGSFHLSTLMYPAHRRTVLEEIKRRLSENLPCRVVSTSLIEAGVDVDFPEVWRETSGLDSICQAAGRCNREGGRNPEESVVTVFDGVSHTPELLKLNIGAAQELLRSGADPGNPETVTQYFRALYYDYKGRENLDVLTVRGKESVQTGVLKAFRTGFEGSDMPFATVGESFHMIDGAAKTVYIPEGDGETLLKRLQEGGPNRDLYRKLGQYAVNVYDGQYQGLLSDGSIEPLDDDSAILRDKTKYSEKTGLSVATGDLNFLNL